jgi:hypothetical protein
MMQQMSAAEKTADNAQWRDTTGLTRWVTRLLYAQIFIGAVSVASGYFEFRLLQDFASGLYFSREQMMADARINDLRQGYIGIVSVILFILAGIAILRWIYFTCRNAAHLGEKQMHYSPFAAVGWYFVPFANLWKPYEAMKEIWLTSASCGTEPPKKAPAYLNAWWFLWLMSGVLGAMATRFSLDARDLGDLLFTSATTIASDVVAIPLSMVFMTVVKEVSQMQQGCRDSSSASSPP